MNAKLWKPIAIVSLCLLLAVSCLYALGVGWKQTTPGKPDGKEMLSLWNDDAPAKQKLIAFVGATTMEGGPDFIPVDHRVAVFDLDGTLFCETDPNYFDYTLLVYRVLEDPDYVDKASDFEKETAHKIVD